MGVDISVSTSFYVRTSEAVLKDDGRNFSCNFSSLPESSFETIVKLI